MNSLKVTDESKEGRLSPAILFFLFVLTGSAFAQSLPDKIRGYKVYQDKITVKQSGGDAVVKIGEPNLVEASLAGVTFELPAEVQALNQSGKVDFLAFHDFKLNGIRIEPEEYIHKFEFRNGENFKLPKPARILLPATDMVRAGWKEMHETKSEWTVTGRVFVFGRFRKYGLYHKRVIPIDINIRIKNPLRPTT